MTFWSPGANIATSRLKIVIFILTTDMNFIDALVMLIRWKQQGWEVHPGIGQEFTGWI